MGPKRLEQQADGNISWATNASRGQSDRGQIRSKYQPSPRFPCPVVLVSIVDVRINFHLRYRRGPIASVVFLQDILVAMSTGLSWHYHWNYLFP